MGVAEEWEEMEEYSQQIDQMKRQVSSLTEALTKLKTSGKATEADCQSEDCGRPIDWYCRYCKLFICTRCSKKPCSNGEKHDVQDFEEMYEVCKEKYIEWKASKELAMGTLSKQKKKLQEEITSEIQKMANASPEQLVSPELTKIVTELPEKRKLLEDVTSQIAEAGSSLQSVDVDSLTHQEFIQVFGELSDHLFEATDLSKISLSASCDIITPKTSYDIDITPSGDILLAGNRGFNVCDKNGNILRSVPNNKGDFTSIQYYKGRIYTLLKEPKGSNKRYVIVYSAKDCKECCQWKLPDYGFVSMLAVSNDKVYAVDSDSKKVKIYSLSGNSLTDFYHSLFKNPVYMSKCAPDGVLLADWSAGLVYKIDCATDKIAWQFEVESPRGVYCDRSGNVWIWSSKEKMLVLRSADGKQVKRFKHDNIVSAGIEYICGFFISDDHLWGAACGKGVVRVDMIISKDG